LQTNIKFLVKLFVFGALAVGMTACGGGEQASGGDLELAPVSVLPDRIRQAPPTVQEAYRFTVANQELVSQFPCYCGCVDAGHQSNLDCYIQDVQPDGSIIFDEHAFG
jgi:hypothetical protein